MLRPCWFLLVAACWSSSPPPAPPPRVATALAPIDEVACKKLASERHRHCAADEENALLHCESLVRLVARAGGCDQEARASYDCGMHSFAYCTNAECCDKAIGGCDDIDTVFTACVNVYCKDHRGDPDCASIPSEEAASPDHVH